ncbi:hypothetical protein Slin15195_G079690 [Septoria linicola]|uniref:Chromo domain-containing protein n=1 Tax=Septoria linicola TaxID=215465 RepID=A0A9Q9AT45_9PEZI|nr:hypothetical protein Slin15195_G079690 [Septoria linicola]
MPIFWTPQMDQKLLIAVLAAVKLDPDVLLSRWTELFGKTIECSTKRATVEHIIKLKKSMGIGSVKPSAALASQPCLTDASKVRKSQARSKAAMCQDASDCDGHETVPRHEPSKKRSSANTRSPSNRLNRAQHLPKDRNQDSLMTREPDESTVATAARVKTEVEDGASAPGMVGHVVNLASQRASNAGSVDSDQAYSGNSDMSDDLGVVELIVADGVSVGILTPPPQSMQTKEHLSSVVTARQRELDNGAVDSQASETECHNDASLTIGVRKYAQEGLRTPTASPPHKRQIKVEKKYKVRSIIDERSSHYHIDWESDSDTGGSCESTWEPKSYANQLAVEDWETKKAAYKIGISSVRNNTMHRKTFDRSRCPGWKVAKPGRLRRPLSPRALPDHLVGRSPSKNSSKTERIKYLAKKHNKMGVTQKAFMECLIADLRTNLRRIKNPSKLEGDHPLGPKAFAASHPC